MPVAPSKTRRGASRPMPMEDMEEEIGTALIDPREIRKIASLPFTTIMLTQTQPDTSSYRQTPHQQPEGLFYAKDVLTFIQKELEDLMSNFDFSVEEASLMAKIACQQQWLFADENKLLERKILLTKLLLELHQQRLSQVTHQAFQAADIELKIKSYINQLQKPSPSNAPNAPRSPLPDEEAELSAAEDPPFEEEDWDADEGDIVMSRKDKWWAREGPKTNQNSATNETASSGTSTTGRPVRMSAGQGGARDRLAQTNPNQRATGRQNVNDRVNDSSQPESLRHPRPLDPKTLTHHCLQQEHQGLDKESLQEAFDDPDAAEDLEEEQETQRFPLATATRYQYDTVVPLQNRSSGIGSSSTATSAAPSTVPSTNASRPSSRAFSRVSSMASGHESRSSSVNPGPSGSNEPNHEAAPEERQFEKRSKQHSSEPYNKESDNPKLQSFYIQGSDSRLIKIAISRLNLYLFLEQSFPRFAEALFDGFVQDAIQTLAAENAAVTEGTFWFFSVSLKLKDARYVEELSSQYSQTSLFKSRYQLPLGDHEMPDFGHNSQDIITLGARKVETLLLDNFYVQDGIDAQGHTNNYTHPAFREIILSFFYADAHSPAHNFNDYFKDQVPDNVLGLVITVVRNCINEYRDGQHNEIAFSAKSYARTYLAVMRGLAQLRQNAIHSLKLTTALRLWATEGCDLADIVQDASTISVVLD
ncbi:hypothetical protein BT96DRAFT_1003104 [Gymnopus androsaceus JB14]|uniref:DUF6532 domain-containing protein n=1 Tax=Gymnopus androsaceus JB14 TaxID=1447944 RepID=A0A6A4GV07_9AGAR|nr:hypothetical protein BT96DRAFT_1003104 [Gymnopus androsaceus JB14]